MSELIVLIVVVALVLVVFGLLAVLAFAVSRRKNPDVEVARQMLNTAMDAYWAGMSAGTPAEKATPPQMYPPIRDAVAYDPAEEQADAAVDEFNEPVDVTGAETGV